MRNATVLFLALGAALLAGGCRRKEASEDPRCRVFEEDPANADAAMLPDLQEAYRDLELLADCARSAAVSVGEYMERHRVQERLDRVTRQMEGTAETVVEGARQTMRGIGEGAARALEEQERRMEEQWRAIRETVP